MLKKLDLVVLWYPAHYVAAAWSTGAYTCAVNSLYVKNA
jgi:hypothetical protein